MKDIYYAMNPWWEGRLPEVGIPRPTYLTELGDALSRKRIEMVIGARRVGKTTLVRQLAAHLLKQGIQAKDLLYLAVDHPQLSALPVSKHLEFFRGLFNHARNRRLYLIFDEVQESPNWETELKAIYDLEDVKLVCTGSTAALLASQGGKLTGRQSLTTVYPLSFAEFLAFRGYTFSQAEDYRFVTAAEEYLETGGYPEQVLNPAEDYLSQLIQDIVARDLVRLQHIRRPEIILDLLRLLAAGVGSRVSYQRLSRTLGVALETVKEYSSHLKTAFLIESLEKWTTSHIEKAYAQRKIYFLDTGIKSLLTGKGDLGAKAENAVFMHLLRHGKEAGYFAESEREVDFVTGGIAAPKAIEVKYDNAFDWKDRRFQGVRLFLKRYSNCREVTVVTRSAEGSAKVNGITISAVPLWKYLL
jgi:hypothetical protein